MRSICINPGEVATEILAARPNPPSQAEQALMLQAEDIAAAALFAVGLPPRTTISDMTSVLLNPGTGGRERRIYTVQVSRCAKLGDWRSLASEGVSSFSTFSCCTKTVDFCTLIGDYVHPLVVLPFKCKSDQLAMGGIYFFEERSRNVKIAGLLFI